MPKHWAPDIFAYWMQQNSLLQSRRYRFGFTVDKLAGTLHHYAQRGSEQIPNDPPWLDYPAGQPEGDQA